MADLSYRTRAAPSHAHLLSFGRRTPINRHFEIVVIIDRSVRNDHHHQRHHPSR